MAFSPQFLDEIRTRLTLSDIIGRSVKLSRKGREYLGLCPFHSEKTPSFTVSDEKSFYHCFGCGAHGDVISFYMEHDGLSFPEAVEQAAREAGLDVPVSLPGEQGREQHRKELIDVVEAACSFYEGKLWDLVGRQGLHYLRGRGLTDDTIRRFRLGFAPAGNALRKAMVSNEIPEEMLLSAGLIRRPDDGRETYDFFRERVIFPIRDGRGRPIAFGGRTTGKGEPKYLNSPDTPLFDKRRTLFGIDTARRAAHDSGRVIVTEGYLDVIVLAQSGLSETVAPLGTSLTENHISQLWKLTDEPVLCFDGDKAGLRAAGRAAERALPLLVPEKSLRFVRLPSGEDPDSLVTARGVDAINVLIDKAVPLAMMIWSLETQGRQIDTPERLAGLEKRLEDRTLSIADRKVQFQYRGLFRQKLKDLVNARSGVQGSGQGGKRGGSSWGRADKNNGLLGGRSDPAILKKRLEQGLLATVLNHPSLLDPFAEDLAMIVVSDPMLDKLLQEILKLHALAAKLDSTGLKNQLSKNGNGEILQSVLSSEVYVHAGFARASAPEDEVRSGFLEILARQLEPARREDLEEARQNYVNDPTDENWKRFEKLKFESARPQDSEANSRRYLR